MKMTLHTTTKPTLPNQTYQTWPTKPNLPNQTYQTWPTEPNLPNQTNQTTPTNNPNEKKTKNRTIGFDTIVINLVYLIYVTSASMSRVV